jgi:hypothetical protein
MPDQDQAVALDRYIEILGEVVDAWPRAFWAKVEKTDGCWLWTGPLDEQGYGRIKWNEQQLAHRVSYILAAGPIPEGLAIDHVCHNGTDCQGGPSCIHRRCVNPAHLEPVTAGENLRRSHVVGRLAKTVCIRGHEFTEESVYVTPNGHRQCLECRRQREREYRERRDGK